MASSPSVRSSTSAAPTRSATAQRDHRLPGNLRCPEYVRESDSCRTSATKISLVPGLWLLKFRFSVAYVALPALSFFASELLWCFGAVCQFCLTTCFIVCTLMNTHACIPHRVFASPETSGVVFTQVYRVSFLRRLRHRMHLRLPPGVRLRRRDLR